jgi:small multidrug resistance pump
VNAIQTAIVVVRQPAIAKQIIARPKAGYFQSLLKIKKMKYYILLVLAIGAEIFATASLKKANGFTVWLPSVLSVVGYGLSAFFLSGALKQIPIGVAYSIWASLGIVCSVLIGYFLYNQKIDFAGSIGVALIIAGVITVSGFSKTIAH